jgi:hypothetical protein
MDTLNKFLVFSWETFSSFLCNYVKGKRDSQFVPPRLANLGEAMVKSLL